jgi:hypothetical protein
MQNTIVCIVAMFTFTSYVSTTAQFGPSSQRNRLTAAAAALSRGAAACVVDTRDRHFKYEQSSNCTALRTLSSQYIDLGGFQDEPLDIKIVAVQAQKDAWMALATSLANGRPISIW